MARDRQTQVNFSNTIEVKPVPLSGGAVTVLPPGLLKLGQFSMAQNVVPTHPGFEKRKGQRAIGDTAVTGTPEIMTLFHFIPEDNETSDQLLFQGSDGKLYRSYASPPTFYEGDLAETRYTGTVSTTPASYGVADSMLTYSNGKDMHRQIFGSVLRPTGVFVSTTYGSDLTTLTAMLPTGLDITSLVSDANAVSVGNVGISTKTLGGGILICSPVLADSLILTVGTANTTSSSTLTIYYWKSDHSWTTVGSITDGTKTSTTTLAKSGQITFITPPTTTAEPRMMYGIYGYWYMITSDKVLYALTTLSQIQVASNTTPRSMEIAWDCVPVLAPEVLVEGTSTWETYSGASVDLGALGIGKKVYVYSVDRLEGIYVDTGDTPSSVLSNTLTINYWNGTAFGAVSYLSDSSAGLTMSGWILFHKHTDQVQETTLTGSQIQGYWYELTWSKALGDDTLVSFSTMPYFKAADYGSAGQCNCAWKTRMVYSFDLYPEYVYISAAGSPTVLAGEDTAVLEVGDGRDHKIAAMKPFFNNLMVFQEEKGSIGGTITMIQGYTPDTFGKLLLSTKVGTFSSKSVDVVENIYTATKTEEKLTTVAYFLSRYGVGACDGTSIGFISDAIQNYFDPNHADCIRDGYEKQMWLKHDPIYHVLRIGLVSGAAATVCNIFPVYDLVSKQWLFDVRAKALACWENIKSSYSALPVVQVAGGVNDGMIYEVNYGTSDVDSAKAATAIDSYITIELPGYGLYLGLLQVNVTCKAQTGTLQLVTYQNGTQKDSINLSMAAARSGDVITRNLQSLNVLDQHISLKLRNTSTTESMWLYSLGVQLNTWRNR